MSKINIRARQAALTFLALALGLFAAAQASAQPSASQDHVIEIKLADLNDDNPLINYRKALLELAMKASGRRYSISGCQLTDVVTSDLRHVQLIKSGQYCNLLATSAGSTLTQGLLPIEFPISTTPGKCMKKKFNSLGVYIAVALLLAMSLPVVLALTVLNGTRARQIDAEMQRLVDEKL